MVRALFFSCGCRFYRFPVSVSSRFLAIFSPIGCRFLSFPYSLRSFPFVSVPVVACPWVICYRSSLVSVSSPVSLFRAVGRGGVACSVGWLIVPWYGVAWMVWCLAVLAWRAGFLRYAGRGVLVGFFIRKLSGGLFVGGTGRRGGLFVADGKGTLRGFHILSGRSS